MFKIYKQYKNGGEILIHPNVKKSDSDYKALRTIANNFAKRGKSVMLIPNTHFKSPTYTEIFGSLIGTVYERKCPDMKVDDFFYEYESYLSPFKYGKYPI